MKNVLVVGKSGRLARAIAECGPQFRGLELTFVGRPEIDLLDIDAASERLRELDFDLLINAVAYTEVDRAEQDRAAAFALNAEAPGRLAAVAAECGAAIVHFSTDYVFSGYAAPYAEHDQTAPLSEYGRTKLEGERRVAHANPQHLIMRTAWLFGPVGKSFVKTMIGLAATRKEVRVVADQRGNPTSAPDLARAALAAISTLEDQDDRFGIYHTAGEDSASWYEFAQAIMEESRRMGGPSCEVVPITAAEYPTPAMRPKDSRLDSRLFADRFGVHIPAYHKALSAVIPRILCTPD